MNSPKEVAQNYVAAGVAKTKLPVSKMILLGVMAGMFTAFASIGSIIAPATFQSASLAKLVGACIFPAGVAMSLIAGGELFTGNCLIIIPVLEKEARISALIKNWIFVYIGNFIGSIIVAAMTVYGHVFTLFDNAAAASAINIAVYKVNLNFGDAVLRGILCNILVCIGVWMAAATKEVAGKIAGVFFPIMLFVLCGFENSIANMYYITTGLFAAQNVTYAAAAAPGSSLSSLTWGSLFTGNLIPVTIGNIIGGAVFVGLGYWLIYLREPAGKLLSASAKSKKK